MKIQNAGFGCRRPPRRTQGFRALTGLYIKVNEKFLQYSFLSKGIIIRAEIRFAIHIIYDACLIIRNASFIIPPLPSPLPGSMYQFHNSLRQSILKTVDFFYPPFRRFIPLQTFRYAACGGANMLFDILLFTISYNLLYKKNNIDLGFYVMSAPTASLLTASFISFFPGFYLSRYVVFLESEVRGRTQLVRYMAIVIICLLLNYYLFWFFINFLGWYPTPSKIMTTVFVVIFSYLSQTYFSFRIKRKSNLSLSQKNEKAYK